MIGVHTQRHALHILLLRGSFLLECAVDAHERVVADRRLHVELHKTRHLNDLRVLALIELGGQHCSDAHDVRVVGTDGLIHQLLLDARDRNRQGRDVSVVGADALAIHQATQVREPADDEYVLLEIVQRTLENAQRACLKERVVERWHSPLGVDVWPEERSGGLGIDRKKLVQVDAAQQLASVHAHERVAPVTGRNELSGQ